MASEIRRLARNIPRGERLAKHAELDPRRVRDFLIFYGALHGRS